MDTSWTALLASPHDRSTQRIARRRREHLRAHGELSGGRSVRGVLRRLGPHRSVRVSALSLTSC